VYVTLASPDYEWGLRILLRSLRRLSSVPVIVLAAPRWSIDCAEEDVVFIDVPSLSNAAYKPDRHEFGATLTKLWIFGLTRFRRITFVDADMLLLKSIDDLFERTGFWAAADYVQDSARRGFNSGLMSFEPTVELRDSIYENAASAKSFDHGDQGLLNTLLWSQVRILPPEYSLLRHYDFFAGVELRRDQVRSIHYINKKPWELWYRESADAALSDLDDLWTRELSHDELRGLVSTWRRRQYVAERARFEARTDPRTARRKQVERRRRVRRRTFIAAAVLLAAVFFAIGFLWAKIH
jgi:lipopolysaccharide biosynthesis glycosyltransferase